MSYGQYIWNFLYEKIGNAYGVAGMMGNIYAESAYYPEHVQGDNPISQYSYDYTADVDSGVISEYDFVNKGPGGGGYGLCQWTSPNRKANLYDRWQSGGYDSIGNIDLQLNFLWWELNNDYPSTLNVLKNATSVREASDYVLHNFEIPEDAYSKEEEREAYSQTAYESFSGGYTPSYSPRLDESGLSSSKWYNAPLNPFAVAGFGLPNCTCYAWGRRGEITGEAPDTSLGDAYTWWDYNKENNIYPYGSTPKLGAIICWDYGTGSGGHVAIVEQINDDGSIVTSNSAYSGTYFYTQNLSPDNNYEWTLSSGTVAQFQGFIYLPDDYVPNPPDDPSDDTNKKKKLSKFLLYAGALDIF